MPSKTETRIYLAAFALVALISLLLVSYLSGHAVEEASRVNAIDRAVAEGRAETARERLDADLWREKYQALTHEVDAVTVMSAEVAFEQGRTGQ